MELPKYFKREAECIWNVNGVAKSQESTANC